MNQELKDEETKNWVKTCLALRCVKEGILPFMKRKCDEQYEKSIRYLTTFVGVTDYKCTTCDINTLKPYHARSTPCKYGHIKPKCCCQGQAKLPCAEGTCGLLFDLIKDEHVANNPNWSNTKSELWSDKYSGPWERMKCFISTPGYDDKADVFQADITACVQICANNKDVKRELKGNIKYLDKVS
ncbi:hypothetical protein DPMN_119142 [Dreissena polymorpha]|uniref:Uncharacterized protein n=1 Tax=Dreissena polymorpha TaxID=45954 RepID=A0A9D4GLD0_DREPO|nr:hypothetical protein DPMN_119142 [Dreissena polymorpha]